MQETPTAEAEVPTPAEVVETPPADAEVKPSADAEETKPEAAAEPATPSPAPEEDIWDVAESERFTPVRERYEQRANESAQRTWETKFQEAKKAFESSETAKYIAGVQGRILEAIGNNDFDQADKFLGRLEGTMEPLKEDFQKQYKGEGASQLWTEMQAQMFQSISPRAQAEMEAALRKPSASWSDVFSTYAKLRSAGDTKPLKETIESQKTQIEELQARLRENKGPDETPSGGTTDLSERRRAYADGEINEYPG
jgi:hypothetical protein